MDTEKAAEGVAFDFGTMPALVLIRILKVLRKDLSDVRNLSYVNKCMRRRVVDSLPSVYTSLLQLDNGRTPDSSLAADRPVLCLRLVCSDSLTECRCGQRLASCPCLAARVSGHSAVLRLVGSLDLSCLRELHITNCSLPDQGEAYRGLLKVLPLNPSLSCSALEHLSVDVCLINLSEIRNAIINVVYQHDDFDNGANIDYIINSAVSQILYTLLIFLDDLYNESRSERGIVVRKSQLKSIQFNFQSREKNDWSDLDPNDFNLTEAEHLRNCLVFMINEFRERLCLQYGITDQIRVTGVPIVFEKDILHLVTTTVSEACDLWPCDPHRKPFEISSERNPSGFDLLVRFPRPGGS